MSNADAPAFPAIDEQTYEPGLTKREYFAAMAMQGMCAGIHKSTVTIPLDTDKEYIEELLRSVISKGAISVADALIKELES